MAKSSVSMRLLIDTRSNKVLFAEANKDCVDFLFHILSLPVAAVISLVKKQGTVGSLPKLYESVENLNESYILPNLNKNTILKRVPLQLFNEAPLKRNFYKCSNCKNTPYCHFTDNPGTVCQLCGEKISTSTTNLVYMSPLAGGYVKDEVTYMIMDNLVVKPILSTVSSIIFLNELNVKEVAKLEEKVVILGWEKAVDLLRASLHSEKVLSDVFLQGEVQENKGCSENVIDYDAMFMIGATSLFD